MTDARSVVKLFVPTPSDWTDFENIEPNMATATSQNVPREVYNSNENKARARKRQRIPHTAVERRYRENLNAHLERLRQAVPDLATYHKSSGISSISDDHGAMSHYASRLNTAPISTPGPDGAKPSKCEIINAAVEYIGALERKNSTTRAEVRELRDSFAYFRREYSATPQTTFHGGDSSMHRRAIDGASTTVRAPTPSHTVRTIFDEVRQGLQTLQLGIKDLSEDSEDPLESDGSSSEILSSTRYMPRVEIVQGSHDLMGCSQRTIGSDLEERNSAHTASVASQETGASPSSNGQQNNRRPIPNDLHDDLTRAEVGTRDKRAKLSCRRFICCFHDGPGRKCSGTDETISEVVKKLTEQHDVHVCDRCWTLKIKEGSSGLFVHMDDEAQCLDHCLSPQCHKTSRSVGFRHIFDPQTCGTKTSRVRPGDSEAVYRFIFQLVNPTMKVPVEVTSGEVALHMDAKPRQGRRKLTREELAMRADQLEKRLEEGYQQNFTLSARITRLEQTLADSQDALRKEEVMHRNLEKELRRVVAMLSDALRTGIFTDHPGHKSLLARVKEDAPTALDFQSESLLTPPEPIGSQHTDPTFASRGTAADCEARLCQKSLNSHACDELQHALPNPNQADHMGTNNSVSNVDAFGQLHEMFGIFDASDDPDGHIIPDNAYNLD